MVRDPSIVSPSLTGVFIGGGHNKHGSLLLMGLSQESDREGEVVSWEQETALRGTWTCFSLDKVTRG